MTDATVIEPTAAQPAEQTGDTLEYAIIEIMGHRRLAGRIMEVERFGAKMLRVDVPKEGDFTKGFVSQFYAGSAIFCVTPNVCIRFAMAELNRAIAEARKELGNG